MNRQFVVELAVLYLPIIFSLALWIGFQPNRKQLECLTLSFLWCFVTIFGVSQAAVHYNWWSYAQGSSSHHGVPFSIWLGWAIAWGIAAPMLPFRKLYVIAGATILDVVAMPQLEPAVVLNSTWMIGELVSITVILIPAIFIQEWTVKRKMLRVRIIIQGAIFFSLILYFIPEAILSVAENRSYEVPYRYPAVNAAIFSFFVFWVIIGVSAVLEFVERGYGTPVPFDPPERLVVTELYSYLHNPMQTSAVGGLLAFALIFESWGIAASAIMVIFYSFGIAIPSERTDLRERFGVKWEERSRKLRYFIPKWQPVLEDKIATIYFAEDCSTCRQFRKWLIMMSPRNLLFEKAGTEQKKLKYELEGKTHNGVIAFAKALQHTNLAWTTVAMFIQFPGISHALQIIADANMFGKTRNCVVTKIPVDK